MKYRLLNFLSILTIILGINNTVQANPISSQSNDQNVGLSKLNIPAEFPANRPINQKIDLVAIQLKSSAGMTIAGLELSISNQIDRYRQSLNLPPLTIDPTFSARARAHSEEMASTGILSHILDSVDQQRKYPTAAENVASIQDNLQPDLIAFQDWIASPAHQQHILGNYNLTGIGVAKNAAGEYYFTQIFIKKLD